MNELVCEASVVGFYAFLYTLSRFVQTDIVLLINYFITIQEMSHVMIHIDVFVQRV